MQTVSLLNKGVCASSQGRIVESRSWSRVSAFAASFYFSD